MSLMKEGGKARGGTLKICPIHPIPSASLPRKEDEESGWPSLTTVGISNLRSQKSLCPSTPPAPNHMK